MNERKEMKTKCKECNGNGFLFWGDEENFDVKECECVA